MHDNTEAALFKSFSEGLTKGLDLAESWMKECDRLRDQNKNLAMFMRRILSSDHFDKTCSLYDMALKYLTDHNLMGSPLRDDVVVIDG